MTLTGKKNRQTPTPMRLTGVFLLHRGTREDIEAEGRKSDLERRKRPSGTGARLWRSSGPTPCSPPAGQQSHPPWLVRSLVGDVVTWIYNVPHHSRV